MGILGKAQGVFDLKDSDRAVGSFLKIEDVCEVLKVSGSSSLWRVRVGEYRVIYDIDDRTRTIDVSVVRHRREAYR